MLMSLFFDIVVDLHAMDEKRSMTFLMESGSEIDVYDMFIFSMIFYFVYVVEAFIT